MTVAQQARPLLVAVPTFRRTELLPDLLAAVTLQCEELPPGQAWRIVLVDNDPERSAEPIASRLQVDYDSQPVPGIGPTRQRALDLAAHDELVIMIDDDLVPEAGWLVAMISTWSATSAAVVVGFVRYVWPEGTLPWIAAGGFMRRTPFQDGSAMDHVATGNVLVDARLIRELGVCFDRSSRLTGGEDTRFGQDVLDRGGKVVASSSTMRDDIAVGRTTPAFVRRRTIGHGQSRTVFELNGRTGIRRLLGRSLALIAGLVRLGVFSLQRLLGIVRRDLPLAADGRRRTWVAIGRIQGALGMRTAEYERE